MGDHLVRATASGVRAFAAVTTELIETAKQRHGCSPLAIAALGRTMTAAILLAADFKNDESITVRVAGEGPLGEVVADARAGGFVRGYVQNAHVDLPVLNGKLAVGQGVGVGSLYVTRFTGLKEPFTGSIPLVTGEIGEDITAYLSKSEQTPSSVALGVLIGKDLSVTAGGGFIVQAMPGTEDEILARIEENLMQLPPISQLIADGLDAEGVLDKIFWRLPVVFHDKQELSFSCRCSKERIKGILTRLGEEELKNMIEQHHNEVVCHFCNEYYRFEEAEMANMLKSAQEEKNKKTSIY